MTKNFTVRLNDDLADTVEAAARVRGVSVNALTAEALAAAVAALRADPVFTETARQLLDRDQEIYKHLANR